MKIAVVCANGRAGQLIVKEAVDRGLDVTAIVRGENKSVAPHSVNNVIINSIRHFDFIKYFNNLLKTRIVLAFFNTDS